MQATGTVQRRSVRAPHTTTATATGSRTRKGIGRAAGVPSRPAICTSTLTHSAHAPGMIAADTAMTTAVAPRAIPRLRHSLRAANQRSPIPGVTLVNRMSAQAAGQRNPTTIATASRSEIFPPAISAIARTAPRMNSRGPVRKRTASSNVAVQTAKNAVHGNARSGERICRKAGE